MKLRFVCAILWATVCSVAQGTDVAVSIRYLQKQGNSHAAIYLFDSNGKLVRQLTKPTDSQDVNPAFAPDGKSLIFTSQNDKTSRRVLVLLKLADRSAKVIEGEPPEWYTKRLVAKAFEDTGAAPAELDTFVTGDDAYRVVLKPRVAAPQEVIDADDKDAFLGVGEKADLIPFRSMPGFVSFWRIYQGTPFPPVKTPRVAVFMGNHNSTDGTEHYVLDLGRQRIVQLSTNGALLFPWPEHPGFFVDSASRYEPLGDGRTVNCNYLDLYNAKLERTRFGHALGKFQGASVFVPGEKPFNIVDVDFVQ